MEEIGPQETVRSEGVVKAGAYVRIEKLGATLHGAPACPMPLYSPNGHHFPGLSLPVSWWMEGYLLLDLRKGRQIQLDRRVRQGVIARGTFVSSHIVGIKGDRVITQNSVWQVRRVPVLRPLENES